MRPAPRFTLHRRLSRAQRGLTLIELLVTIAVLAIMATIGVPSFQAFTARNEVAAEVLRITTALSLARNTAITRRTTITVCPSTDRATCNNSDWSLPLVIIEGRADGGTVDGEVLKVMSKSRVPRVTYRNDNRPIRYGLLGRPSGHNGTFRICGRHETGSEVSVSNFGRVRSRTEIPQNC